MQVEHSDLINQVDVVRDSALDLMNRSDKYHKMVEPELTALNQHWEEVSTRLKVCDSAHVLLVAVGKEYNLGS